MRIVFTILIALLAISISFAPVESAPGGGVVYLPVVSTGVTYVDVAGVYFSYSPIEGYIRISLDLNTCDFDNLVIVIDEVGDDVKVTVTYRDAGAASTCAPGILNLIYSVPLAKRYVVNGKEYTP